MNQIPSPTSLPQIMPPPLPPADPFPSVQRLGEFIAFDGGMFRFSEICFIFALVGDTRVKFVFKNGVTEYIYTDNPQEFALKVKRLMVN